MHWIAALPMYNVTPALAADWLNTRGDTLAIVDPGPDLTAFWLRDDVLLSQTCGYPLVHALADRVRLVAAPDFDVPGCADGTYRSVLVAGARVAEPSIEACRGLCAAYNADDSNSGMNLLRHAVAPFARDGRFFASVTQTGSIPRPCARSPKTARISRRSIASHWRSCSRICRSWRARCACSGPPRVWPHCRSSRRRACPRRPSTRSCAR